LVGFADPIRVSRVVQEGFRVHSQRARGMRHVDLTDVQLASSETARRINRDIVLELIRANEPVSRADLSRRSGLQRSTVSQIVEQLIGERWVCEGAVATAPRGRRPTLIGLNDDLVAIAVDIHPKLATCFRELRSRSAPIRLLLPGACWTPYYGCNARFRRNRLKGLASVFPAESIQKRSG
jgi:MarR family